METTNLVEAVVDGSVFSITDPKNPEKLVEDPSGFPYKFQADELGNVTLSGGKEVPEDKELLGLLDDNFTQVYVVETD